MNPKVTRFLIFLCGSMVFSAMARWMIHSTTAADPCQQRCNSGEESCMRALELDGAHPVGAPGAREGECNGVCLVVGRVQHELRQEAEMEGLPAPPLHACLVPVE
ncbi:MAG: hypothetical protein H6742_13245 [Alphaproteobacteria bacterium]|nr:hypothetical protein [Alphaproteobacteria bacterium]